eukprot:jgi/Bigna1/134712/aug1.26_g9420
MSEDSDTENPYRRTFSVESASDLLDEKHKELRKTGLISDPVDLEDTDDSEHEPTILDPKDFEVLDAGRPDHQDALRNVDADLMMMNKTKLEAMQEGLENEWEDNEAADLDEFDPNLNDEIKDDLLPRMSDHKQTTTFVGVPSHVPGNGEKGPGRKKAKFMFSYGLAFDSYDNLYVGDCVMDCDYGHDKIRKISPSHIVTTYAGNVYSGLYCSSYADGPRDVAEFHSPYGIAVDDAGNQEICDLEIGKLVYLMAGKLAVHNMPHWNYRHRAADPVGHKVREDFKEMMDADEGNEKAFEELQSLENSVNFRNAIDSLVKQR